MNIFAPLAPHCATGKKRVAQIWFYKKIMLGGNIPDLVLTAGEISPIVSP